MHPHTLASTGSNSNSILRSPIALIGDYYGDSFKDDITEKKLFGIDIVDRKSFTSFKDQPEIPDPKSTSVSFMKIEELPFHCKKRTQLRLIQQDTGGHEAAVVDLTFSPVRSDCLCSIDQGDSLSGSHVIVWKRDKESNLDFQATCKLPIRGCRHVLAHPTTPFVWALADEKNVAVFSSVQSESIQCAAGQFIVGGQEVRGTETILDIAFTSDGGSIIAAVESNQSTHVSLHIWRIENVETEQSLKGAANLTSLVTLNLIQQQEADRLLRIYALDTQNLVTVSTARSKSSSTVSYILQVWNIASIQGFSDDSQRIPVQMVAVELPLFKSRMSQESSSLKNPNLECSLWCEHSSGRYLVLASRRSNFIAVLAVAPASDNLSLYHVTYTNLKAPVVSMNASTILGREHHSSEETTPPNILSTASSSISTSIAATVVSPSEEIHHPAYPSISTSASTNSSNHSTIPLPPDSTRGESPTLNQLPPLAVSLSGINAGKSILDTLTRPNLQQHSQQTSFPQPRVTLSTTAGIAHTTSITEASLPKALLFEPAKNVSILNLIKPNQSGVPRNIPPTASNPNPSKSAEPIPIPITEEISYDIKDETADLSAIHNEKVLASISDVRSLLEEVQKSTMGGLTTILKRTVEMEAKKAVEEGLKSATWKKEVATLKEAVRESVKETLKTSLPAAFKTAFEKTLLPAFQAGTRELFNQIQTAFETGMARMISECSVGLQQTQQVNIELRNEIQELQSMVIRLESNMNEILSRSLELEKAKAGLVSEAVIRAVEKNYMPGLVALLERLTPLQLLAKCSPMVQLCVTQRLAEDMSVNVPQE
eukprot:gene29721-38856_t